MNDVKLPEGWEKAQPDKATHYFDIKDKSVNPIVHTGIMGSLEEGYVLIAPVKNSNCKCGENCHCQSRCCD